MPAWSDDALSRREVRRLTEQLRVAARARSLPPVGTRRLRYHAKQAQLWDDTDPRRDYRQRVRFVAVAAGRRSGKTDIALHHVLRCALRAMPWPGNYGIGAPTRGQAKRIYWRRLKHMVPAAYLVGRPNESELSITLLNGNTISLHGMEVPQRIEGSPWDGWLLDEYADMAANVVPFHIRPTLADRGGWLWQIGVPEGRNHFHATCMEYRIEGAKPGARSRYYHWSMRDVLPLYLGENAAAEEIALLRRELEARIFAQEVDAEFVAMTGRIYYAFDPDLDVHEFPMPQGVGSEGMPWVGGMDFNVSPMCAVWGWEEKRGADTEIFVWDEIASNNADTRAAARQIRQRCSNARSDAGMGWFLMHPDPSGRARKTSAPAGQTDLTILAEEGFRVRARATAPLRRDRYNSVNTMLCAGDGRRRVHIHPRCKNLIRSLEGLLYAEGTNEPDLVKCPNMDHAPDGFGYWIEKRHPIRVRAQGFTV